jgi:hypothetical protein
MPDNALQEAARRFKDAVDLHLSVLGWDAVGRWVAVSFEDGSTDNTLYAGRDEAVRAQGARDNDFWYWQVAPDGVSIGEAAYGIQWARSCRTAGLTETQRLGRQLIMPLPQEDIAAQLRQLQRLSQ